ncbi:MAG TPA: hypothetical protein VNL39_16005 [Xanthobacteraceae bacterium]|nr:hypothetical protein [Xanthobacteraceae bacterium]
MKNFAGGIAMAAILFSAGSFAEAQQGSQPSQGAQISQSGTSANRPRGELKMGGWSDYGVKKIDAMTLKQTYTKNSKKKKQIRHVQRQFD